MTPGASRIRRAASWLAISAGLASIGAVAGGIVDAIGADGAAEVLGTIGYSTLVAWPVLFVLVTIIRLLWWGWRPAELSDGLVDANGGAPRLAAWVAYLFVGSVVLAWGTFNAVTLLATWTTFRATVVALVLPPVVVAISLALLVASIPVVDLMTRLATRVDGRWRRRRTRSLFTPRAILLGAVTILLATVIVAWTVSIRPRLGYVDLGILCHPIVAVAATTTLSHAIALRRRARMLTFVVATAIAFSSAGFTFWLRASRPLTVLQLWARPTIASEVIEKLYYLEDIREDIALLVPAPPRRAGATPRDIVLVTIDTLRADHTPLAGGTAPMPHLAELGTTGAVFTAAFSPGNVTRRSIPSIVTGLSATRVHGKVAGWALRLDPRHIVLAERFRAAGYDTAGFFCCPSFWSSIHHLGINRGIDHISIVENDGTALAQAAHEWIVQRRATNPTRPLFVWVHFIEPHNWTQHAPPMKTSADRRAQYDKVLGEVDGALGVLVDAFRDAGEHAPIIAVTADHGEALGDHGQPYHGTDLYDSQIHVPLVIAGPGIPPHRVDQPIGLVGLAPTLLDLAGFAPPTMPQMDGASFASLVLSDLRGDPEGGYAFAAVIRDRSVANGMRAIIRGRWKLIETTHGYELYDRVADPSEQHDLAGARPDELATMRALLDARKAIDSVSPFGP